MVKLCDAVTGKWEREEIPAYPPKDKIARSARVLSVRRHWWEKYRQQTRALDVRDSLSSQLPLCPNAGFSRARKWWQHTTLYTSPFFLLKKIPILDFTNVREKFGYKYLCHKPLVSFSSSCVSYRVHNKLNHDKI